MINIIPSSQSNKVECDNDQVDRLPVKKRKVNNNCSETSSQESSSDDDDINTHMLYNGEPVGGNGSCLYHETGLTGDFYGDVNDFQDLLNLPSTGKKRGTTGSPSSSSEKSNSKKKMKKKVAAKGKNQPKATRQVHKIGRAHV